jgi:hypothetical protein
MSFLKVIDKSNNKLVGWSIVHLDKSHFNFRRLILLNFSVKKEYCDISHTPEEVHVETV